MKKALLTIVAVIVLTIGNAQNKGTLRVGDEYKEITYTRKYLTGDGCHTTSYCVFYKGTAIAIFYVFNVFKENKLGFSPGKIYVVGMIGDGSGKTDCNGNGMKSMPDYDIDKSKFSGRYIMKEYIDYIPFDLVYVSDKKEHLKLIRFRDGDVNFSLEPK